MQLLLINSKQFCTKIPSFMQISFNQRLNISAQKFVLSPVYSQKPINFSLFNVSQLQVMYLRFLGQICQQVLFFHDFTLTALLAKIFPGFSTADRTWLPVADGYETLNVEYQRNIEKSHMNVYKALAKLRTENVFRHGRYESVAFNRDVLGFRR